MTATAGQRRYARGGPVRGPRPALIDSFDVEPAKPYDGPIRPLMAPYEPGADTARLGSRQHSHVLNGRGEAVEVRQFGAVRTPGCQHRQAVTVELCTGEVVACICIACLEGLQADWIDRQREQAEREARCDHRRLLTNLRMGVGVALHPKVCAECGASVLYP